MSSPFSKVYPGNERLLFDGGLDNKYEKSIIPDNESPDCLNVIFENGAVQTRGGTSKFTTAAAGSFVGDGLYTRHANDGSETMVAFGGGHMFTIVGTSFTTVPSAQSVFTAGIRVGAAEYENYLFIGNGSIIPYKYNGTFTRHGVYPAVSAMSKATAGTGNALTGDFRYAITNVNSNLVESDVGPFTTTITVSSQNVALTGIPVAPTSHGINTRRIYRTQSGATAVRIATLNDNTTTTYEDAITSTGANAPTDNGVPPTYQSIIYHKGRMFCIDPTTNFLKYSEIGDPYTFKSTSFRRIGDNTGDIPVGLDIFDDSVVVFCKQSQWLVYMASTDPIDWRDIRVRSPYGSMSPFASFKYNNKVMFAATQNSKFVGFAAISGDSTDPSATILTVSAAGSDLKSDPIEPDMFLVQASFLKNISSIIFQNRAYISLTHGAAQTENNRVYLYDFAISNLSKNQEGAWVPWSGIRAAQMTVYNGNLYYLTATGSMYIYTMNTSIYNDDGAAINSYFWTKEYSGDKADYNVFKDFRYANILFGTFGDYFMGFTYKVDSDIGDGNSIQISINPGGSLWGTMRWGLDNWGGGVTAKDARQYLGSSRGKRIQFKFDNRNTLNQGFKVIGLNFVYTNKGRR